MPRVPFPNENICSTSHILELLEEGLLDYFFFLVITLFPSATVHFTNSLLLQACRMPPDPSSSHNALDWPRHASVKHPRSQSQEQRLALPSHRSDSPHFGRQSLLKPSLQILHVGRFWPWNKRGSPSLGGAGGLLLADFSAEDVEGIEDIVVVFTDRYFVESTAQHVGQLKSMLRLHLFNMQEISFVCYDDNGDGVSWVQLSNVMVKVTEEFIALIICDGEDNHQGVCPANASVQLLVTIQTVLMDLKNEWSQIRELK